MVYGWHVIYRILIVVIYWCFFIKDGTISKQRAMETVLVYLKGCPMEARWDLWWFALGLTMPCLLEICRLWVGKRDFLPWGSIKCSAPTIVLWVELCPPRRDVEVLISVTCECDLIWKQGLGRCHQIKMKSLGRALIQYDQGLYIKKRRSTWVKHHVKTETHRHNLWRWRPS